MIKSGLFHNLIPAGWILFLPFMLALLFLFSCAGNGENLESEGLTYDSALGWYDSSSMQDGTIEKKYATAKLAFDSGDYKGAYSNFLELKEEGRGVRLYPDILFYCGECLFNMNDYYGAYKEYKELIQKHSDFSKIKDVAEKVYEIGDYYLAKDRDAEFGSDTLRHLLIHFPYEHFSDDAWYKIGVNYMKTEFYNLAVSTFETLLEKYPRSKWADVAAYNIALCFIQTFKNLDYDMTPLKRGRDALERFREQYPNSSNVPQATELISKIDVLLSEKDFIVGMFYFRDSRFDSAKIYFESLVRDYPNTPSAESAREMLKKILRARPKSATKEIQGDSVKKEQP